MQYKSNTINLSSDIDRRSNIQSNSENAKDTPDFLFVEISAIKRKKLLFYRVGEIAGELC